MSAARYLPWLIFAPFFCVWPFLFDGVYIGMTRTAEMRNCLFIAMLLFFVVAIPTSQWLGNHGLWLGMMVFMLARGVLLAVWFPRASSFSK